MQEIGHLAPLVLPQYVVPSLLPVTVSAYNTTGQRSPILGASLPQSERRFAKSG
jgi:hypothetical protein